MTTAENFQRLRAAWDELEAVMNREPATRALWAGLKIAIPWVAIAIGTVLVYG